MGMRTRLQLVVAFVLLGALVSAGALLPARIAEHLDGLLLDKVETQALAPDEEMPPSPATTPLAARIRLRTLPSSEVLSTQLETGKQLNEESIGKVLGRELDDLRARGLFPVGDLFIDKTNISSFEARPVFHVVPSQPDLNGIIWEVLVADPAVSGGFYLDDESGKIISFWVTYEGPSEELISEQSGEQWLAYLELPADGLQVSQEPIMSPEAYAGEVGHFTSVDPPDVSGDIVEQFNFVLPTEPFPLRFYCSQHRQISGWSSLEITPVTQ
jgi:hypothetical protein